MVAMQKHNKQADNARGMQKNKVTEVESSMIEKETVELCVANKFSVYHCMMDSIIEP